jgi:hypothetical protein
MAKLRPRLHEISCIVFAPYIIFIIGIAILSGLIVSQMLTLCTPR